MIPLIQAICGDNTPGNRQSSKTRNNNNKHNQNYSPCNKIEAFRLVNAGDTIGDENVKT